MKKLFTWIAVLVWLMFANSSLMVWITTDTAIIWKVFYTVFVIFLGYVEFIFRESIIEERES